MQTQFSKLTPSTTEPTTTEPSPGDPDLHPMGTAPITVSRDCAGHAWMCLSGLSDLLTDTQRQQALAELHAALWPEAAS